MDPFALLKRLGTWQALNATLVKKNGETIQIKVKQEQYQDFPIESQYNSIVRIRFWSTSDAAIEPGEGDVLEVSDAAGNVARYPCARNPQTTRYWDWRFLKNGNRKVFYTRY